MKIGAGASPERDHRQKVRSPTPANSAPCFVVNNWGVMLAVSLGMIHLLPGLSGVNAVQFVPNGRHRCRVIQAQRACPRHGEDMPPRCQNVEYAGQGSPKGIGYPPWGQETRDRRSSHLNNLLLAVRAAQLGPL
jgi:hypothetical protein